MVQTMIERLNEIYTRYLDLISIEVGSVIDLRSTYKVTLFIREPGEVSYVIKDAVLKSSRWPEPNSSWETNGIFRFESPTENMELESDDYGITWWCLEQLDMSHSEVKCKR